MCANVVTCLWSVVMKCSCVCVQCSSNSGSEESAGSECVWGAGARAEVYTHPGETAPFPGTLYFVSPGTLGLSERFHKVCYPKKWAVLIISTSTILIIILTHIFLSQLLFSVGRQRAGDEGAGQAFASSAGSHASSRRAGLQRTEWKVGSLVIPCF